MAKQKKKDTDTKIHFVIKKFNKSQYSLDILKKQIRKELEHVLKNMVVIM